MEKEIKTIKEQAEENVDKAQKFAAIIFTQYPFIKSVGICIAKNDDEEAIADCERKGETWVISDYPI